jgi:hypothetical protein
MKRGIDNALLLQDLDADGHFVRHPGVIDDPDLLHEGDDRLTDARNILPGTVTNESIAPDAAIDQQKINFSGQIPSAWLGTGENQAAKGNEVLYNYLKGQPNGYAGLDDVTGKMPSGSTPLFGTGSLVDIQLEMPPHEFTVVATSVGTTRDFTAYWLAQPPATFFGNMAGVSDAPTFESPSFGIASIPDIDASKVTSEVFPLNQLPVAVGVGAGHSAGVLPTTGTASGSNQPTDYLGRDMLYHPMAITLPEQPDLPAPTITIQSYYLTQAYVNIAANNILDVNMFYKLDDDPFVEVTTLPLLVPIGTVVSAYVAKVGYNNSPIYMFTVPIPPGQ